MKKNIREAIMYVNLTHISETRNKISCYINMAHLINYSNVQESFIDLFHLEGNKGVPCVSAIQPWNSGRKHINPSFIFVAWWPEKWKNH